MHVTCVCVAANYLINCNRNMHNETVVVGLYKLCSVVRCDNIVLIISLQRFIEEPVGFATTVN